MSVQFGELLHALEHFEDVSTEGYTSLSSMASALVTLTRKQQHQIGMITTSSFLMALSCRQGPSGITFIDG